MYLLQNCIKNLRPVSTSSLRRAGLAALIGSLYSMPAYSDTLTPFVSASINHDDNLFRLSDDQSGLVGSSADTYRSVIGGVSFERPFGRQLFSGLADFSSMKFDRNNQLDYTGKNLSGEWHWFLGERFEGHLGASYAQALAPFADFHTVARNLRTIRKQYADGSLRFHSSWQWRAAYVGYEYAYDLPTQRGNDRKEDSLTAGIDYLARSGSTVGFQFRRLKGRYPYVRSLGPGASEYGFVQDEAKVNVLWLATGSTQVLFLGGWARRKQNADADRADSGTNARLILNWAPAKRVKLTGQVWREFAAIDGALVDSALTTGASATTTWDFSEKIQAVLNLKRDKRRFTQASTAAVSLPSAFLSDSSHLASLGIVYKPTRKLTLNLSAFRDQRSGSPAAGTNSYKANGASFNATMQF